MKTSQLGCAAEGVTPALTDWADPAVHQSTLRLGCLVKWGCSPCRWVDSLVPHGQFSPHSIWGSTSLEVQRALCSGEWGHTF